MIWRTFIFAVCCKISHYQLPANLWLRQLSNSERRFTCFRDGFRHKCYSHTPADQFKQGFQIGDFEGHMPVDAGSKKSLIDQFSCAPVRFEIKRFVLQRSEGYVIRFGVGVAWCASGNECFTSNHIRLDIGRRFAEVRGVVTIRSP